MPRQSAALRVPGEIDPQSAHELTSDPDAAISAAQSGNTRKIQKPRVEVAPAVLERPDPDRPKTAGVNRMPVSTIEECKEQDRSGKLQRPVLTADGYYVPRNSMTERQARKRQNLDEFVEIE